MANVPREKVLVGMPLHDRRLDVGTVQGLMTCTPFYERPFFMVGMSDICLARNTIAHLFVEKATEYDWLMFIDSDICFSVEDWQLLWEGDDDVVTAPYARKMLGEQPAEFGLGFTRIHRSVFEKIKALNTEEGAEYAQRFIYKSEMHVNYFPNGGTHDHRYVGEDRGFFILASLTDIKPRVERRTKLRHVGPIEFSYPEQIPLQMILKMLESSGQLDALRKALNDQIR